MGITIAVLWVATFVIAVILWRARLGDRATDQAIRLGLLIALAGLLLGGLMVGPTPEQQAAGDLDTVIGAHSVGVPDGGPAMPLTGWSTTGGDLRIPHFLGMHALQAHPAVPLRDRDAGRTLHPAAGRAGTAAAGAGRGRVRRRRWSPS